MTESHSPAETQHETSKNKIGFTATRAGRPQESARLLVLNAAANYYNSLHFLNFLLHFIVNNEREFGSAGYEATFRDSCVDDWSDVRFRR